MAGLNCTARSCAQEIRSASSVSWSRPAGIWRSRPFAPVRPDDTKWRSCSRTLPTGFAPNRPNRDLKEVLEARVAEALKEREDAEAALRQAQKNGSCGAANRRPRPRLQQSARGHLRFIRTDQRSGWRRAVRTKSTRYIASGQATTRRAASLTHRLLAFSRRQTLSPKAIVINRLLHRFRGAGAARGGTGHRCRGRVEAGRLWSTWSTPTQLERMLPAESGHQCPRRHAGRRRITIETANRWRRRPDGARAPPCRKPEAVYHGLRQRHWRWHREKDVLDRVFDPFFTTKPLGEGTGAWPVDGLRLRATRAHGCPDLFGDRRGRCVCALLSARRPEPKTQAI